MAEQIDVQAARIPDRDRLLDELRAAGLDARPIDEVGIEVVPGRDAERTEDEVFSQVEQTVLEIGAQMIPQKHEGVIYVRPPVS
jgi:hypothetical protein